MKRAVGYVRVSSEEQAKEGVSLEAQTAKLRAYAELYEITLVAIEADEGVSAKSLHRPGLQRALTMIDRGKVEGLLITKLDRLSRKIGDWDDLIDKYFGEKPGKRLWSVSDQIDTTTASGRMVLNMMMTVAQWEREIIGERTSEVLQHKIKTGTRCGELRYGQKIDPTDPRRAKKSERPIGVVACSKEVKAIRLMKTLKADGKSLRAIASELDRLGFKTKEGGRWHHSTVGQILKRTA